MLSFVQFDGFGRQVPLVIKFGNSAFQLVELTPNLEILASVGGRCVRIGLVFRSPMEKDIRAQHHSIN